MKYRFKGRPYPHQVKGLKHLWKMKSGGLFWDPGTGKTRTALDFASLLYREGMIKRVLVVCPINALYVWPAQAKRFATVPHKVTVLEGSRADKALALWEMSMQEQDYLDIVVVNYDALIKTTADWPMREAIMAWEAELLVCDESQKLGNATSKRSKALHIIGEFTPHVVLMTGTPLGKAHYLKLYSQLKTIDPNIWKDYQTGKNMPWTKFKNHFAQWGGRSGYEFRGMINLEELEVRYKPWITTAKRVRKKKPTDEIIRIPFGDIQTREAYNRFSKEGVLIWKRNLIEAPIILTKLLRLQEMTGGWVHDEVGEIVHFHSEKINTLASLVNDLQEAEKKVIVFARFKAELEAIQEVTKTPYLIKGGVSGKARDKMVRDFTSSPKPEVMIIQIGSAEALDGLQHDCSYAIFYSTDYSWENFSQARGRIDRSGQTEQVTFYHIHVAKTVDTLVLRALRHKQKVENLVMEDPDLLIS